MARGGVLNKPRFLYVSTGWFIFIKSHSFFMFLQGDLYLLRVTVYVLQGDLDLFRGHSFFKYIQGDLDLFRTHSFLKFLQGDLNLFRGHNLSVYLIFSIEVERDKF
jgi:hypothetical protein